MTLMQQTLGEIVASNFKAATVFEKYNMDFCCHGDLPLIDACRTAGVDDDSLANELSCLEEPEDAIDFRQWPIDLLTRYIQSRHHIYVESVTPTIAHLLYIVCEAHGRRHPELLKIRGIFNSTSIDLAVHMKKEELILFPFIRQMSLVKQERNTLRLKIIESIISPIAEMKDDHLGEGEQLGRMATISDHYTPPGDACASLLMTYKMLKDYEADMHRHIHLENNILFPAALALERELRNIL